MAPFPTLDWSHLHRIRQAVLLHSIDVVHACGAGVDFFTTTVRLVGDPGATK